MKGVSIVKNVFKVEGGSISQFLDIVQEMSKVNKKEKDEKLRSSEFMFTKWL